MWPDPIHPGPRRIMDCRLLPIADLSVLSPYDSYERSSSVALNQLRILAKMD